ncbi:MAG TPA: hypothetical protein VFR81_24955 [Longimicrobium sp.]|nr:hypothetical protein [Longimicrobium sp.]
MYRHCIHCSAGLGTNESLEAFPVGRTLAFDGEKGRLWAVCKSCGRWNLAPIEERWEAVEDAERSFAGAPKRASTGTLAMAKLRDGTRLVRVGDAPPAEVAVRRYGKVFGRRRLNFHLFGGGIFVAQVLPLSLPVTLAAFAVLIVATRGGGGSWRWSVVSRVGPDGAARPVRMSHLGGLSVGIEGDGTLRVELPAAPRTVPEEPVVVRGDAAARLLARFFPNANRRGGHPDEVRQAVAVIQDRGGAEAHLRAALRRPMLLDHQAGPWSFREVVGWKEPPPAPIETMALEMALHEEQERRAMEGELRVLEAAWREAEEIAGIADRLAAQMGGVLRLPRGG